MGVTARRGLTRVARLEEIDSGYESVVADLIARVSHRTRMAGMTRPARKAVVLRQF